MKQVQKTAFSAMTSPELAAGNELLEIVSNKTVIGYFVPIAARETVSVVLQPLEERDG